MCTSEMLSIKATNSSKLEASERTILRKIVGPVKSPDKGQTD